MADGVIAHEDVLHQVYAFLRAYGYNNALLALQTESRVPFNTIEVAESSSSGELTHPTPDGLAATVRDGEWDTVLSAYVDSLLLPEEVLFDLYECIFEELLTLHCLPHAARALFANSPIFETMRQSAAARYARLQQLHEASSTATLVPTEGPPPPAVLARREALLKLLQESITWNTEPYDGALPAAIWHQMELSIRVDVPPTKRSRADDAVALVSSTTTTSGNAFSKTTGVPALNGDSGGSLFLRYPLRCPSIIHSRIAFANAELPTACAYVPAALAENSNPYTALLVGKTDGSIDFLNAVDATPMGPSVGHTDGVLSLTVDLATDAETEAYVSNDSNGNTTTDNSTTHTAADAASASVLMNNNSGGSVAWLAAGYRDGWVKVYNTHTRRLIRRFERVHDGGVTAVLFAGARSIALSGHRPFIVSGGFDGAMHLLDLLSGSALHSLRAPHGGMFVLALCAIPGGVVSAGNDGTLGVWAFSTRGMERVGPPRPLRAIHAACKEDCPTRLLPLESDRHAESDGAFVVLTRGRRVLLLAARADGDGAVRLRTALLAPRPVHAGCCRVTRAPALAAPVLSLFLADREGTVLLYSVEMAWRGDGARAEVRPTDESAAVVVECGRAVEDLSLVDVPGEAGALLAYAPSLPSMYLLAWS